MFDEYSGGGPDDRSVARGEGDAALKSSCIRKGKNYGLYVPLTEDQTEAMAHAADNSNGKPIMALHHFVEACVSCLGMTGRSSEEELFGIFASSTGKEKNMILGPHRLMMRIMNFDQVCIY